ncbi:MAG: response regulator [Patescibacteria group bacterium]
MAIEKKTILVIDDYSADLDLMAHFIKRGGHEVLIAKSAENALDLIAHLKTIDLVIADNVMPRMHGLDMIKKIRDEGSNVLIWLVSGQLTEHIKILAMEYGASKVISKTDLVSVLLEEKILPPPPVTTVQSSMDPPRAP